MIRHLVSEREHSNALLTQIQFNRWDHPAYLHNTDISIIVDTGFSLEFFKVASQLSILPSSSECVTCIRKNITTLNIFPRQGSVQHNDAQGWPPSFSAATVRQSNTTFGNSPAFDNNPQCFVRLPDLLWLLLYRSNNAEYSWRRRGSSTSLSASGTMNKSMMTMMKGQLVLHPTNFTVRALVHFSFT